MATTIAISDDTHAWLTRLKRSSGLRSFDEVLGALAHCGEHMADRVLERHRAAVDRVCKEFGIKRLTAFGSRAWGAPHAASDLDLVAEFRQPVNAFVLLRAQDALAAAFEVPVDLHTWETLKPRVVERVRERGVRLLG